MDTNDLLGSSRKIVDFANELHLEWSNALHRLEYRSTVQNDLVPYRVVLQANRQDWHRL